MLNNPNPRGITICMASRWFPSNLDALYRRCTSQGPDRLSKIGREETLWFLQEALLEEQTFIPPDAERIKKLKTMVDIVDRKRAR
jgi:hypothetical protein